MNRGQRALELTSEEIIGLTRAQHLPVPRFLDRSTIEAWPDEVAEAVSLVGIRSLSARGLLRRRGESFQIPARLAHLAQCISRPALVAEVRHVSPERRDFALFYAGARWTAGHRSARLGNHQLTLFASQDLYRVLGGVSGIDHVETFAPDLEVSGSVSLGTVTDSHPADLLAEVLQDPAATAGAVTVVEGHPDGKVVGAELCWVLTAKRALARVERETSGSGELQLVFHPSTPDELHRALRELLPGVVEPT